MCAGKASVALLLLLAAHCTHARLSEKSALHGSQALNARQWADAPVVPGRLCPTSSVLGEFVRRHKLRTPPADFNNGAQGGAGNAWMQRNWEPHLRCVGELRLGQPGDGGKHVCDPDCLLERNACLVYSFGSNNDFGFESSVLPYGCVIHVFDHTVASPTPPAGVTFHRNGIAPHGQDSEQLKAFSTLLSQLGHRNETIDILKMDVEGAEYDIFLDGATLPLMRKTVRQILLEVHYKGEDRTVALARAFTDAGFYTFSKEPNIQYSSGDCVEFSLLNTQLV